jgi:hypothetical protein
VLDLWFSRVVKPGCRGEAYYFRLAMSALSVEIRYPYDRKGKVWRIPSCVLKPSTSGYLKPTR